MHKEILDHFHKYDEKMHNLALKFKNISLKSNNNYFLNLAESIVNQQLSEKAGATIWKRFLDLFSADLITPEMVKNKSLKILRNVGMSYSKAQYIHNIADEFINENIDSNLIPKYTNEEIINNLIKIKGIGRWTAEMFLIFSLGREDVFSIGDTGLLRAIQKLYGEKRKLTTKQIVKISSAWIPYRSYACLLLWKSLG
jgi:DNA-3-methyladenine glycosylase II